MSGYANLAVRQTTVQSRSRSCFGGNPVKNIAKLILCSVFAIATLGRPATAGAQVPAVDSFFVFGDSLSDTGNDFIATKFQFGLDPAIPPSEPPHRTYFMG